MSLHLRPRRALVASLCLGAFAAFALCCALFRSTAAAEPDAPARFDFALLGDPQIGYGRGGEYADAGRFGQVVDHINAQKLPLSIVAGDLVQDRTLWQDWIFDHVRGRLGGTVVLAPGNHDVVDEGSLAKYRARHGKDYFDVVLGGTAFVVVDSETARDRKLSPREFDAQWSYLASALAAHQRAARKHIVLVMHRPPFVNAEDEPEDATNWPPGTRARLLTLARQHGVRHILAGHLHRTHTAKTADGIEIVVSAGSAASFDQSPVGYYLFHVDEAGLHHELVSVAPAPPEPFSVPGLRQWTPRLFDFSIRHWLFTAFYVIAGLLALGTSKALAQRSDDAARRKLWLTIAVVLFFYGVNMQLDFDELIGEVGRIAAKLSGVFAIRHVITASAGAVISLGTGALLLRFFVRAERDRFVALALIMLAIPTAWFCLSVISHHDIGMVFNEMWWDLLILLALIVIGVCARLSRRRV